MKNDPDKRLLPAVNRLNNPGDYFSGVGVEGLMLPRNVILFKRIRADQLVRPETSVDSHHRWVAVFCLETGGTVVLDQRTHRLEPNSGLLIFPHQAHHFSGLDHKRCRWLFVTFEWPPTVAVEALRHRPFRLDDAIMAELSDILDHWLEADGATDDLLIAVYRLIRSCKNAGAIPGTKIIGKKTLLARLSKLLRRRSPPSTVAAIAAELAMPESTLRDAFKRETGLPIGSWLSRQRLHQATALLETTALPVAVVAERCHYHTLAAFSHAFRRQTGLSPSQYRRSRQQT